jgi:hypothetical protein
MNFSNFFFRLVFIIIFIYTIYIFIYFRINTFNNFYLLKGTLKLQPYEANIEFVIRFMVDANIVGCNWWVYMLIYFLLGITA